MGIVTAEADQLWMQTALQLAEQGASQQEVPVGALVIYNNEIVGQGWNQPISRCDPSAHAEVLALREAAARLGNYRLLNSTVYVTLEPCAMCLGTMLQARIEKLVFGAFDPKAGAVKSVFQILDAPELNHQIIWQGGILADECANLLKKFFQLQRVRKKNA